MAKNDLLQVERETLILQFVRERGAVSIHDLSEACNVTVVTIRRDLQRLEERQLIRRTHGGAVRDDTEMRHLSKQSAAPKTSTNGFDRIDALITTYPRSPRSRLLFEQAQRQQLPIISESERLEGTQCVGIDNYPACYDLGVWIGQFAPGYLATPVQALNITYHFPGSRERSRGFIDGLMTTLPSARIILSVDGRSLREETQRIVEDALAVYPNINMIFTINDDSAIGALDACRAAGIDDRYMIIACVGLGGPIMRHLLAEGSPLKACAAMFPELVARVALGAAIKAGVGEMNDGSDKDVPYMTASAILTPSKVIHADNLAMYYCAPDWTPSPAMLESLIDGYPDSRALKPGLEPLPGAIGFVLPFNTHEWYQTLIHDMRQEAQRLDIELLVEDATASPHAELDMLAQLIGTAAAALVKPGETIILDHEPACLYLAQQLIQRHNLTVITNSLLVAQTFSDNPNIHVILTGGDLDPKTQALGGRIAELALAEFHADKVFVGMSGINQQFGISSNHHDLAQIQRAMIGAAQQVIVLSDHTHIGAASRVRVAPIHSVHMLVTDSGLSSADRLALSQIGIKVVVASG